jgi:hypothetical protein
MERDRLVFKVDNEIIFEENTDLTLEQIDHLKIYISKEMGCFVDEVEVVVEKCPAPQELSNVDCTSFGLVFFDEYPDEILGVKLNLVLGSDEHLEAISNGTLEKYLIFFV